MSEKKCQIQNFNQPDLIYLELTIDRVAKATIKASKNFIMNERYRFWVKQTV